MKCLDLQFDLSLYSDGLLSDAANASIASHLDTCPVCRQTAADIREMRADLRRIGRPQITPLLKRSVKDAVRAELRSRKRTWIPVSPATLEALEMRLMPFSVGVFASVLIGAGFLSLMFSGMLRPGNGPVVAGTSGQSLRLLDNDYPSDGYVAEITPSAYARTRLGFAKDSPSVNPQGALIALTKSLVRGGMKDDEVVVVADVFGNGLAHIAEVVEPSRDSKAVLELQRALESDPAYAAFVPTTLENRPESVRVILKIQNVNVRTQTEPLPQHRKSPSRKSASRGRSV